MALLAKELNPFSISPIMFCHIATGSLLLSAIGVLQHDHEGSRARLFVIPHRCAEAANTAGVDLPLPCGRGAFCGAKNRAIESSSQYHSATIPGGTAKVNATAHQPPRIARANGIELCYEIFR